MHTKYQRLCLYVPIDTTFSTATVIRAIIWLSSPYSLPSSIIHLVFAEALTGKLDEDLVGRDHHPCIPKPLRVDMIPLGCVLIHYLGQDKRGMISGLGPAIHNIPIHKIETQCKDSAGC